ncbi:MAG TPA: TonB-dependent receptor plug domain-containing protein, partial [Nitrosopumilaceae archaeon]|nr:TonB-dependent receptor plug domain-containing protein [Nitrosopumilaceae archaeon]
MRITAIFLLTGFLQVSAYTNAQEKITLSEKSATLQKVFEDIQKQTSYNIWFDKIALQKTTSVSFDVKGANLEETLDLCCKDQPLEYSFVGKNVVIRAKQKNQIIAPAEKINIKGKVLNEKGDPAAAVTVTLKGTSTATLTDANGEFSLNSIEKNARLVFSSVNLETFEADVNGQTFILVTLKTKISSLQDVIVNKGYYSTAQLFNTGSVSKVTAEDIQKQPISNPLAALEGRVTGLVINQQTGVPGGNFSVQIRGQNSLRNLPTNNGNLPLYIIDGVPFLSTTMSFNETSASILGIFGNSPLNSINPADIESIEILKDADATAIYGSRGANGIILITTKKGKIGQTKVDLNIYSGVGNITRRMNLLNTQQYLQMRREAFANDGISTIPDTEYDLTKWD